MRVPFEWLKEFVDIDVPYEKVAERLTMIGFEVEGIESIDGDIIFEVNVTPNRPDCLSILGIAREVSAAFRIPLNLSNYEIIEDLPVSDFSIEIVKSNLCNRYAGRLIKGVNIGDSPTWIKTRLEKCGIRAINNIVDVTNYVLLEFGHPLHAFDADTLYGKKIVVNTAGVNMRFMTLDGIERELPEDALLIWDSKRPIAIAGIMGGLETEVSYNTKNIFLESAYFFPFSIRKTSKGLNLVSESSYRFERGTDIEFLESALNRAALLIREIAGGMIYRLLDEYPVKYTSEFIKVRYKKINRILGTDIKKENMIEIIERLGLKTEDMEGSFMVYPTAFRRDIQTENDIAEEVARFYGYNRILNTIPKSPLSSGILNRRLLNIKRARESMRKSGFTEVINYSFMSPTSLDMLNIPEDDNRRRTISILNPLKQEESLLRTTLIKSLLNNFKFNLDRGLRDIRFFEISKVFQDKGEILPMEELRLGTIYYREKTPTLWNDDTEEFYISKGALELLFEEFKIYNVSFYRSSEPFLHKGKSADIYIGDSYLGYIGVISPEIIERLDCKRYKPQVAVFEINLDLLFKLIPDSIQYLHLPKYPAVERDLALVIDESITALDVDNVIKTFPSEIIEEVSVFDVYRGKNIPAGKKSIAFNIVYRSKEKTLRDDEVEKVHRLLIDYVLEKTGGELRG